MTGINGPRQTPRRQRVEPDIDAAETPLPAGG